MMENNEMNMMEEVPTDEISEVASGNYLTTAIAGVLGCALGAGAILLARKVKGKKDGDGDQPKEDKPKRPFWKRKAKEERDIIVEIDEDK